MLVIPLGLIGAALAVWARGLSNDVYFQVGLLTTMGLSAKNAILIVEFAEGAERRGLTSYEAAIEGGFVLTSRGGDFELDIGQDISIGYSSHSSTAVELYFLETFTFRLLTTEAAVVLAPPAK